MNKLYIITTITVIGMILSGCSSDDNGGSTAPDVNTDGLAVFFVNAGDEDFDVQTDGPNQINFCYEGEGCESSSGGGFATVFEGQRLKYDFSDSDKRAVGVIVGFEVTGGTGYVEIVSGESFMDDGWPEFSEVDVVYTSETFEAGDTASFSFGNTD